MRHTEDARLSRKPQSWSINCTKGIKTYDKQEPWKAPLPQFIEEIYFKRFKREEPETVKPLKQVMAEMEIRKKRQKAEKEERRKQRASLPILRNRLQMKRSLKVGWLSDFAFFITAYYLHFCSLLTIRLF